MKYIVLCVIGVCFSLYEFSGCSDDKNAHNESSSNLKLPKIEKKPGESWPEAKTTLLTLSKYTDCGNIIELFLHSKDHQIDSSNLKKKYKLEQEMPGANSGAKVFFVTPDNMQDRKLILKTLPPITKAADYASNENLREAYFSCKNSNITSKKYLPDGVVASIFSDTL